MLRNIAHFKCVKFHPNCPPKTQPAFYLDTGIQYFLSSCALHRRYISYILFNIIFLPLIFSQNFSLKFKNQNPQSWKSHYHFLKADYRFYNKLLAIVILYICTLAYQMRYIIVMDFTTCCSAR